MSTNLKTTGVFLGGLLVGAAAVWLSPPDPPEVHTPGEPPPGGEPGAVPQRPADAALPPLDAADVTPGEVPPEIPIEVPMTTEGTRVQVPGAPGLLDEHIAEATDRWVELRARAALKLEAEGLLPRIDLLIEGIPEADEALPPVQDLVVFLVEERLLLDALDDVGVEVSAEKAELDVLLRPPRGQVKGGADKAKHPGGKAPEGSRPLDPDAPRNVGG